MSVHSLHTYGFQQKTQLVVVMCTSPGSHNMYLVSIFLRPPIAITRYGCSFDFQLYDSSIFPLTLSIYYASVVLALC
jgi:hypothetical protein